MAEDDRDKCDQVLRKLTLLIIFLVHCLQAVFIVFRQRCQDNVRIGIYV